MPYLNRTQIIGYVCNDPIPGKLPSGIIYSSFTVGLTERWKETLTKSYFKTKAFGKIAGLANSWIHKGCLVYVDGRIIVKKYQKEGSEMWNHTFELYVERLQILAKATGGTKWKEQEELESEIRNPLL